MGHAMTDDRRREARLRIGRALIRLTIMKMKHEQEAKCLTPPPWLQ